MVGTFQGLNKGLKILRSSPRNNRTYLAKDIIKLKNLKLGGRKDEETTSVLHYSRIYHF